MLSPTEGSLQAKVSLLDELEAAINTQRATDLAFVQVGGHWDPPT